MIKFIKSETVTLISANNLKFSLNFYFILLFTATNVVSTTENPTTVTISSTTSISETDNTIMDEETSTQTFSSTTIPITTTQTSTQQPITSTITSTVQTGLKHIRIVILLLKDLYVTCYISHIS